MKPEEVSKRLEAIYEDLRDASRHPDHDLLYATEKLNVAYELLTTRYAPFKVGERVILKASPDFDKATGWIGYKRILVAGARGTVDAVDVMGDDLIYHIAFDISEKSVGTFAFRTDDLTREDADLGAGELASGELFKKYNPETTGSCGHCMHRTGDSPVFPSARRMYELVCCHCGEKFLTEIPPERHGEYAKREALR